MGGAQRYPSIAVCEDDGFREGLHPSYGLEHARRISMGTLRRERSDKLARQHYPAAAIKNLSLNSRKEYRSRISLLKNAPLELASLNASTTAKGTLS
jgi:hypothetical protein